MDEIQTFLKYSLKNLLVMMALLITGGFWYSRTREQQYYSPVRILKNGVEKMADGELGV